MNDLTSKDNVIKSVVDEWNRRNAWKEGGLKLAHIEKAVNDAQTVDAIPVSWIMEQIREQNFDTVILSRMLRAWREEQNEG